MGGKIGVVVDIRCVLEDPVVHLPYHAPGVALEGCGKHKTLLVGIRARHCELQRADAEEPVDIALLEVNGERRAHEDRVEILASHQARVLHPAVGRIHRLIKAGGAEQLQRIDGEIERDRRQHDERAGA